MGEQKLSSLVEMRLYARVASRKIATDVIVVSEAPQ